MTDDKMSVLAGRDLLLIPDFSYVGRANWGLKPMNKRIDPQTGKRVPHPDGEFDPDFVPVSKRAQRIGCNIQFYDPFPDVNDGSDLADYLIEEPPPPYYEMPAFDELILPNPEHLEGSPEPETEPVMLPLTGRKSFNVVTIAPKITVDMLQEGHEAMLEGLLNEENIKYLIEKLDIRNGIIEPLK